MNVSGLFSRAFTAAILLMAIFLIPAAASAEKAPRFWISSLDGDRFISQSHQGGIIISFFYVDCAPCKIEVPELYRLVQEKNGLKDVKLLFVDPLKNDSKEAIREFAARRDVPVQFFYHDSFGRLAKKFFGNKIVYPAIVGIKDGEIRFRVHQLDDETAATIRATFSP
ncbi:TlpA family protein disulfide reductase [bacterium]|nr:TlpA family protein disulfide reductase [bacterium]